ILEILKLLHNKTIYILILVLFAFVKLQQTGAAVLISVLSILFEVIGVLVMRCQRLLVSILIVA
ncbi:MAG: hypothetical protein ACKO96_13325, partial [Flammeovirgaceae bacterium]